VTSVSECLEWSENVVREFWGVQKKVEIKQIRNSEFQFLDATFRGLGRLWWTEPGSVLVEESPPLPTLCKVGKGFRTKKPLFCVFAMLKSSLGPP
jgi:hypothetical protein